MKIKKGFTLIELLIVILLIGILSGVLFGVINSAGIKAKARDAQRIADLKKIQTALELYFSDYRQYPVYPGNGTTNPATVAVALTSPLINNSYISVLPEDPSINTSVNPCGGGHGFSRDYWYMAEANGSWYVLVTNMEALESSIVTNGATTKSICQTLGRWATFNTSCTIEIDTSIPTDLADNGSFYCYGVENPF